MHTCLKLLAPCGALLLAAFYGAATAQDKLNKPANYPVRPIRIVVAVPPGAGGDAVARMASVRAAGSSNPPSFASTTASMASR